MKTITVSIFIFFGCFVRFSRPNCDGCRDLAAAFINGVTKTSATKFSGGNSRWEGEHLGSYATSETRLHDILDQLCASSSLTSSDCHDMVDKLEDQLVHWWNSVFKVDQNKVGELESYICISATKYCCPFGYYGPECKECQVCSVIGGKCDGNGSRIGSGKCVCNVGYVGEECNSCDLTTHYKENSESDQISVCRACHISCIGGCNGSSSSNCVACAAGWTPVIENDTMTCTDINECEKSPCRTSIEYCSNTPGSYECLRCDRSCSGCNGPTSNDCIKCATGYHFVDSKCVDVDECSTLASPCPRDEVCHNTEGGYRCDCKPGFLRQGGLCVPRPTTFEILLLSVTTVLLPCQSLIILSDGDEWTKKCSEQCSGKTDTVQLAASHSYQYEFSASYEVTSRASNPNEAVQEVKGSAKIVAGPNCDVRLTIEEAEIQTRITTDQNVISGETETNTSEALKSTFMRACYDNGRILFVAFPRTSAPIAVNLQKALLSQLQITTESLEIPTYTIERDIAGDCITEYTPEPADSEKIKITKRKYTSGCDNKYAFHSTFSGISVQPPTKQKKLPFLDGQFRCDMQLIPGSAVMQSDCVEKFSAYPGMSEHTEVVINTHLELVGDQPTDQVTTDATEIYESSLLFTHADGLAAGPRAKVDDVWNILATVEDTNDSNVPRAVYSMAKKMRTLDKMDMTELQTRVQNHQSEAIKTSFKDILSVTGTESSIQFIMENSESLGFSTKEVARALQNVRYPTVGMGIKLVDLLAEESFMSSALPISSFIYKLCERNPSHAGGSDVRAVVQHFVEQIGEDCSYENKRDMNKIILTLHALGNVGPYVNPEDALNVLSRCLQNPKVDASVQVAAADSVRRAPCNEAIDDELLKHIVDHKIDSEVRIMSYRSYMRCPSSKNIESVLKVLEQEVSQQVGSFIYSHLSTIPSTSSHSAGYWKALLAPYVDKIRSLADRFDLTVRSYSKYLERFRRTDEGGLGIQATVIYGPESPIPRSVSLNLTLEKFGREINLGEIGFRSTEQTMMEQYLLRLYRPFAASDKREKQYSDPFDVEKTLLQSQAVQLQAVGAPDGHQQLLKSLVKKCHIYIIKITHLDRDDWSE
ncbi:unnamed protein product [Calicophoron daubneyi]|uniref:Uncharacterized protein n=1 Tax=Calicophoron daubneyi TaxID=300641 RepID=A0AAV2TJQ8_CALDB